LRPIFVRQQNLAMYQPLQLSAYRRRQRNCPQEGVALRRFATHNCEMVVRIDPCLDVLRRLVVAGDTNGIPLAERAITEYWEGTPPRARKSGLLYMQQILHEHRDAVSRESRDFADTVDAYIERMLAD
jgi:hypothetical protein